MQLYPVIKTCHVISCVWVKEELAVPMNSFVCEWEGVRVSVFTEVVGEDLGHRRSRWYWLASICSVGIRMEE